MKKEKKFLLFLVLFIALTLKVKAITCDPEKVIELASLANNVNITYQKYDKEGEHPASDDPDIEEKNTYPAFNLVIYNLPDNLRVKIKGDGPVKTVSSEDKDENGTIYVDLGYASSVKNIVASIESVDLDCYNQIIKSVSIAIPMYNEFSSYDICSENPEHALCQEFTNMDYSDVLYSTLVDQLTQYQEQKEQESSEKKSSINVLVVVIIIAVVIVLCVLYILWRRRSEK